MEVNDPFQLSYSRDVPTANFDELEQVELREIAKAQRRIAEVVGDDLIPFLALAPYVPMSCMYKIWSGDLEKAIKAGLVQSGPGPSVWDGPVVWLERAQGESALSDLKARRRDFATLARKRISDYASTLLKSEPHLEEDPGLLRWTLLAVAAGSAENFHSVLLERVNEALKESRRLNVLWSPEARAWIEAAAPFGDALEGAFQATVGAAKRRFELFHRRAHDQSRLRTYYPRDELDQVFLDLLKDERFWGLHFIGDGGTGKTMLIRHLAIEVAEAHGAVVSRVDFDYLNPNYPKRDPLLLLRALAEEFRLDESSDAVRSFADFDNEAEAVYRRVEDAARSGEAVQPSLKDEDVQLGVHSFAEALAALSYQRQPVLILDTCEELAKKQPSGEVPENVQHTLDLLRIVHDGYTRSAAKHGLRVIFSGRRGLPYQDFLRVHRVGGFSSYEAEQFLQRYRTAESQEVPRQLRPGILKVTKTDDGHNPYDLDTYAGWACVDKTLTQEKLETSGPLLYIQERIVDRLTPMVRRVFPALATMGRFDTEVVTGLIGDTNDPASDLAEVLSQEWVHPDSAGAVDTFRIEDLFRQRVLKYYRIQGAALHDARLRLSHILPRLTRTRKFDDLTPQLISACLDVLSDAPLKAAGWWEEMEARIARDAKWDWATELMQFLEPAPDSSHPLTAAIFATKAAVMLHNDQDPGPAWTVVEARWHRHPEPRGASMLRWRSSCGLGRPDYAEPRVDAQGVASMIGCFDRHPDLDVAEVADVLSPPDQPDLAAFGHMLVAIHQPNPEAFRAALEICRRHSFPHAQVWLDWIRPPNLKHRILLEAVLAFPDQFPGEFADLADALTTPPLTSIDSDRLASVLLRWAPNWDVERLRPLYASSLALANQTPTCIAHRLTPPLFVAHLDARAMTGEVRDSLTEINRLSTRAKQFPPDVRRAIDMAALRIIVRMRLTSEGLTIPETVRDAMPLGFIASQLRVRTQDPPADLTSVEPIENSELNFLRSELVDGKDAYAASAARNDTLGRLESHMLEVLSHARQGQIRSERADKIRQLYEHLTSGDSQIPSWDEITEAARTGAVRALLHQMGQRPALWRPWVVRILAWHIEPAKRAELAQWILENDSVTIDGTSRVPAELEFVCGPDAQTAPRSAPPRNTAVQDVFYLILGFLILGGGVYALYRSYVFLIGKAGLTLGRFSSVASFVAVLPTVLWLASRAPRILGYFLDLYSRTIRIEVVVDLHESSPDLNRPFLAPSELTAYILALGVRLGKRVHECPASSSERYAEVRRELLPNYKPNPWLFGIFRIFPTLLFRVELTVDQRTAASPWEIFLVPELMVAVRRVTRERRIFPIPPWSAPVDCRTWGARSISTTRKSWGINFHASLAGDDEPDLRPNPKTGVLRLVGLPIDSREGIAMQVASSIEHGKPRTVRCSDLLRRYPGLRLCILQCPTAEIRRRLSSDRRNAAILRRFGADVFTGGVPAVITIPPLPEVVASDLISDIYDMLGSRNGVPFLEAVIARVRRQSPERIAPDREDASEIMNDVCLYAINSVSFRTNS